jgi:thiol-disulfide isomerase/thioredoxin
MEEFRQSRTRTSRKMKALVAFSLLNLSSGFSVGPSSSRRGTSLSVPFRIAAPSEQRSFSSSKIRPQHRSGLYALVADEKEELHKRKEEEEDGNSNNWTETPDGGFLPNFLGVPNSARVPMNDPRISAPSTKNNFNWLSLSPSTTRSSDTTQARPLITEVKSLQDYKAIVADEKDAIVVVRFYASWCRACRAVSAPYRQLATKHSRGQRQPNVKFVEVPLTPENAVLHQGLGVPSLPYGHIYHPEAGLVEERSLNKKRFGDFVQILQTYVDGECPIEWEDTNGASEGSA